MKEVVICSALRTAMGTFQGQWSMLTAPELGAQVIKSIVYQTGISHIDECILGCVLTAGVGQAPARQALLKSGLSHHIPCTTVNKVCGSAIKAVAMGCDAIVSGNADILLAGGMESMSHAPHLIRTRQHKKMGHEQLIDHLFYDGLENPDDGFLMGHFADQCADQFNFSREQQDEYAIASVQRARQATENGFFKNEIVPLNGITEDEAVYKSDISKIPQLKPVFNRDGSVTAANASSISDGAAVLLLSDIKTARASKLPVLGMIRAYACHAQAPETFTTAVQGAIEKVLQRCGWSVNDVDLFEINEAFAVVVMAAMQRLKLSHEQVNVYGGACAMGHPIGASGARIIITLIHAMIRRGARKGIAAVCIGGGEAMAVAIERVPENINERNNGEI